MTWKEQSLRWGGTCAGCGATVVPRASGWYESEAVKGQKVRCVACGPSDGCAPATQIAPAVPRTIAEVVTSLDIDLGVAGKSARDEYERRHERREQHLDMTFGRFAPLVKFLTNDPQSTTAWAKGSRGERELAEGMQRGLGARAVLLHDRQASKGRGNIDHIVIAQSGVWVVDAKNYEGVVERRDKGGWRTTDHRLYVRGRDQTKLVKGLAWQLREVREFLNPAVVPIVGVLCFTDADWKWFAKPFTLDGVLVTWPRALVKAIAAPGPLTPDDVARIATEVAQTLVAKR